MPTSSSSTAAQPLAPPVKAEQSSNDKKEPEVKAHASPPIKSEDTEMSVSADHRRTDHERQDDDNPLASENLPLLCSKPHPLSKPHPTQDLVGLYSLSALASTVARRDPVTGAKINKLRKSYEGKVKKQDLPGRNKPTVLEGELMGFMEWPEEGWFDQRIYGRELEHALDPVKGRLFRSDDGSSTAATKLERALQMNPGLLPRDEDEKWRATLALDEPQIAPQKAAPPTKPPAFAAAPMNGLLKPGLTTGMRSSAPASPAVRSPNDNRPDRTGKKRRYDDASFEGYEATGWAEDDGYSTGGGGGDSAKRGKRRRVSVGVS